MDRHKQGGGGAGNGFFSNSLTPEDVNDIIDRLNVGTLRREVLRERTPVYGTIEVTATVRGVSDAEQAQAAGLSPAPVRRQRQRLVDDGQIIYHDGENRSSSPARVSKNSSKGSQKPASSSTALKPQQTNGGGGGRDSTLAAVEYAPMPGANEEPPSPNWRGPSLLDALTPIKDLKLSPMDRLKRLFKRIGPGGHEDEDAMPKFPQYFLTKYMGKRGTKGLWGSKYTRRHVETVVDKTGDLAKGGGDLPLVTIEVTMEGLRMTPHKRNKVATYTEAFVPIQYISYGVQDSVFPRLFSFIMVREMSSVKRRQECHIYACDTVVSSRRLATALAIAFQTYSDSLQGAPCKFSVSVTNGDREDDAVSSYDA